ncbi:putative TIM-barrel fold metal-dependent hydrolase [Streptomyces ambofaciens]|uniref:hypothetical protein n=1 Tax=unclassified Streptomyces TaxID=2593676 RepID=UPI0033DD4670
MTVVDAHLHVWDPAVAAYDWLGSAMAPVDRAMRFREARGALRNAGVGAAVLAQAADHDAGTDRAGGRERLQPGVGVGRR